MSDPLDDAMSTNWDVVTQWHRRQERLLKKYRRRLESFKKEPEESGYSWIVDMLFRPTSREQVEEYLYEQLKDTARILAQLDRFHENHYHWVIKQRILLDFAKELLEA
jgi:hypothetical protein